MNNSIFIKKLIGTELFKGSLSTFINRLILLLVPLIIIPLMITRLGKDDYGIWLLIQSFTSYLGLFNLGLLQYLQNKVAGDYATLDFVEVKKTYKSIQKFYFILAVNITLLLIITLVMIKKYELMNINLAFYLSFAGTFFIWSFPTRVYEVVIRSLHKIQQQQIINSMIALFKYLTIIILLILNFGLFEIILANGVFLIIPGLVFYLYIYKKFPVFKTHHVIADKKIIKKALIPGFNFLIIQVASTFAFSTDNFVIAANINLESVSKYGTAFSLILFANGIISILPAVAQPIISSKYRLKDFTSLIILYKNLRHFSLYLAGIISIILIFSGEFIFTIWVKKDIYPGNDVFIIMVIFLIIQLVLNIDDAIVMATTNHKVYSIVCIIEGIGNLILSIIFIKYLGLFGVILATVLMRLLTNGIYLPYKSSNILNMGYGESVKHITGGIFLILFSIGVTYFILIVMPSNLISSFIAQFIGIIFFSITYYLMVKKIFKIKKIDI